MIELKGNKNMDIKIEEEIKTSQKKIIGTQVSLDIYEQLLKEAEENFMSISDILRKIIYTHCRQTTKEKQE